MLQSSRMPFDQPRLTLAVVLASLALMIVLVLCPRPAQSLTAAPTNAAAHGPYTTNFSRAETPLSDGGLWLNGKADGLDWTDVHTSRGFAFGTEIGGKRPAPQKYDDSTALLKGAWGPDQTAQATVRSINPNQDGTIYEEVELRLRSTITPHSCTGYEVMFRCTKSPKAYCNIARWEGPLGIYTMLKENNGSQYGVQTGDVVKASMIGNVLTVWINGTQVTQLSDDKFKTGNPGIGFYLEGATGRIGDYGFTNFSATDR